MQAGFIEVDACWVCGGETLERVHDAILDLAIFRDQHPKLAAYGGRVWFRRCGACGFAQPEQMPALPEFFDCLYDQLWSEEWVIREFESPYKDVIFHSILRTLDRRSPPVRRLLDIGAHAGRFLDLADRAGWRAEGIELNPRTAAYAARRTGLPVHQVNVDRLVMEGRSYGAVTLTDVLEHIPEPVKLLARVHDALVPGGVVAIKVPSGPAQRIKEQVRAWIHRGYRPRLADNLVHVNHFSVRSLRVALERAGFEDVRIAVGAPELPPASTRAEHGSNLFRRALYFAALTVPGSVHSPLALNLQAYARRPAPSSR